MKNKRRVSQTFDTPPICNALITAIGYDVEKESERQILEGTFVSPTSTRKYMQKVLDHLRMPRIANYRGTILTLISTQEHIRG